MANERESGEEESGLHEALASSGVVFELCRAVGLENVGVLACVSRLLNTVAGSESTLQSLFAERWYLRTVEGSPPDRSFWARASLASFAIEHAPLQKHDTLTSLALQYGVDLAQLKRVNGTMNDTALAARERALVPVHSVEQLRNQRAVVQVDTHTRRAIAVLTEREQGTLGSSAVAQKHSVEGANAITLTATLAVSRNLSIPADEAKAYLALADGDARMACSLARDDASWHKVHSNQQSSKHGLCHQLS